MVPHRPPISSHAIRRILWVIVCSFLLLSACNPQRTALTQAVPLITQDDFQAQQVAAAVGSDGSHHILYSDYSPSLAQWRLVYAYQKSIEPPHTLIIVSDQPNQAYTRPDIVVAENGVVFLAWKVLQIGASSAWNCWASLTPDASAAPACQKLSDSPPSGVEPLALQANGNTVYAVFTRPAGGNDTTLSACQLAPVIADSESDLLTVSRVTFGTPALAVDADGMLHVAFRYIDSSAQHHFRYLRYTAGEGQSTAITLDAAADHHLSDSSILISNSGNAEIVYIAFIAEDASGAQNTYDLNVYQRENTAVASATLYQPLSAAQNWQLSGRPALAREIIGVYAYFEGSNSADPQTDLYSVQASANSASATPLTDDAVAESSPWAVTVTQAVDPTAPENLYSAPVILYRNRPTGNAYGDVQILDRATSDYSWRKRMAFDSGENNIINSYDLAASGDHALAVWIDVAPGSLRQIPWMTYNVNQVFLPTTLH